jgi:hypothetical protein
MRAAHLALSTLTGSTLTLTTHITAPMAMYSTLIGSTIAVSTLTVTSSLLTTGNVGIGTTNPLSQLTLHGGNRSTSITVANGFNSSFFTQYGLAHSAGQYSAHSVAGDTVIDAVGGNLIMESPSKNIYLSVPNANTPNLLSIAGAGTQVTNNSAGWASLTNTQRYSNINLTWTAPETCYISSISMYLGQGNNGTNIAVYVNGNFINEWWPFQGYGLYVISATGSSVANGVATTPTPFSSMNQLIVQAGQTVSIWISALQTYNFFYYGRDSTTGGVGFSVVYSVPKVDLSLSNSTTKLLLGLAGVGIGTTAPVGALHVHNSSSSFTGAPTVHIGDGQTDAGGTYGMLHLVRANNAADNKAYLSFIKNGSSIFGMGYYPGSNVNVFGLVPSFSAMNVNSGLWINSAGSVGIGTTNPNAFLSVNAGATNTLALNLVSSGPGWGSGMQFTNSTASTGRIYGIYSGSDSALHVVDSTAGADRVTINAAGRADFYGNVAINNGVGGTLTKFGSTSGYYGTFTGGTADNSPFLEFWANGSRRCYMGNASTTEVQFASENGAQINFLTGGTSRMTINTAGNASFTGNVGVSGRLQLVGSSACEIYNGNIDTYNPTGNNNLMIRSWWGIGFPSYDNIVRIGMDTRTGNADFAGAVTAGENITMRITKLLYLYYISSTNHAGLTSNGSGDVSIFTGTGGVANRLTITAGGNVTASNNLSANCLIINGGGTYQAGCIYSDVNWGMLFRAKVAPSSGGGIFGWYDSAGTEKMKMLTGASMTHTAGNESYMRYGPNSMWGAYLVVGATDGVDKSGPSVAAVVSTNGNLHIDAGNSNIIYYGYYANSRGTPNPHYFFGGTYEFNSVPQNDYAYSHVACFNGNTLRRSQCMMRSLYANESISWGGGVNLTYAFYKYNAKCPIRISGKYAMYSTYVGLQYVGLRIYSQFSGAYFYYSFQTYQNQAYVQTTYPFEIIVTEATLSAFSTGWYDIYFYGGGGVSTDGNDQLYINVEVLPVDSF